MGRGLAAILSPDRRPRAREPTPELRQLPVELIAPEPAPAAPGASTRTRCSRWPSRCASAACCSRCSCARCPGGTYELIAGERRWRAAQLAGLETVPGARARRTTTRESLELALIENMAREDLNPVEEARACALLVEELGLTREEVGRRVGRSRVAVSNLLRLLDLPDEVLDLLVAGRAHRGPRPRAADGARPRRPPPPRPRRGRRGLDRARDRGARRATPPAPPEVAPQPPRRAPTRTRSRPPSGSATPSAARSAPTSASPRAATGYTRHARLRLARRGEALAERLGALEHGLTSLSSAPQRAISSVG